MITARSLIIILTVVLIIESSVIVGAAYLTQPTESTGVQQFMSTEGPTKAPTVAPIKVPDQLSGTISIDGSTTVQPVSELLAIAFHENNTGVKIMVQGGGSGKGQTDAGMGLVDIGSASEDVPANVLQKYPNLTTTRIGASAVIIIVNAADDINSIKKADLVALYDNITGNKPAAFKNFTVYTRAESSGTADTFSSYALGNKTALAVSVETTGVTGNPGIIDGVASAPNSIGFVDYGFAVNNPHVRMISIVDGDVAYPAPTKESLLAALKGDTSAYPVKLTRPLNYLTNGEPTPLVQAYIDYVLSPQAQWAFEQNGFFSAQDISSKGYLIEPTGTTSAPRVQLTATPTKVPAKTPDQLSETISIDGSTTVQPVSELLSTAYHDNNPGVKLTVQGGGSGKGMTDAGMGLVDIGSASEDVPASTLEKFPNLTTHKIGASAVIVIVNAADNVSSISKADMAALYDNVSANKPAAFEKFTIYTRAESSGTADTFSNYVLGNKTALARSVETTSVTGNTGVVDGVASTPCSIGFADYGFAVSNPNVRMIGIIEGNTYYPAPTKESLLAALKGDTSAYPIKLTRPLNYLTNGQPTPLVQDYIDYVKSPEAKWAFEQNGFFSIQDLQ